MFYLQFCPEPGAIMSPRNIIREVAEIIGTLHKGPHPESLVEGIKPLSPQGAEELPVILKSFLEVVVEA